MMDPSQVITADGKGMKQNVKQNVKQNALLVASCNEMVRGPDVSQI